MNTCIARTHWIKKRTATYAKISPKMLNPRDIAGERRRRRRRRRRRHCNREHQEALTPALQCQPDRGQDTSGWGLCFVATSICSRLRDTIALLAFKLRDFSVFLGVVQVWYFLLPISSSAYLKWMGVSDTASYERNTVRQTPVHILQT